MLYDLLGVSSTADDLAVVFTGLVLLLVVPAVVVVLVVVTRSVTKVKLAQQASSESRSPESYDFDVFLSYSAQDYSAAKWLAEQLEESSLRVFFADSELEAGERFTEEIRKALRDSNEMWVLATPESIGSVWVATEWGTAWALDKRIVPVLLKLRHDDLPDRLRMLQAVDYSHVENEIGRASRRVSQVGAEASDKDPVITFVLCLCLGILGAHRFYLGKSGTATLQLMTLGGIVVWTVVDLVMILAGAFTDAQGRRIESVVRLLADRWRRRHALARGSGLESD